jgi:hypothetical protein
MGAADIPGLRSIRQPDSVFVDVGAWLGITALYGATLCVFSLSDRRLQPLLTQNPESLSHAQPAPAVW